MSSLHDIKYNEFTALKELCRLSKNLYNLGLYTVRQYYFQERKHLKYESNYHHCKGNENYRMLNTDIAPQTLKVVDRTFRSFYGLITSVKSGSYSRGKRVKRGLYRTQHGILVNSDCNGAANILRKSKHNALSGVSRGCLAQPLRVKIS